jgi:tetratricopeptide (TPR) repeat protein
MERRVLYGGCLPLSCDIADNLMRSEGPTLPLMKTALAALAEIAAAEAQAGRPEAAASVAEIAGSFAPDDVAAQRLLQSFPAADANAPPEQHRAAYHLARGRAFRALGERSRAEAEFHAAIAHDADVVEAYIGLSEVRLPGEGYQWWLRRLHEALLPQVYLEIGVEHGHTLSLANPPTRAIGIDPQPMISVPLRAETQIFRQTSDDFFAEEHLRSLLSGNPLSLAFIDGAHVFAQSLRDFMHVEAYCGERSLILLHDTIPLDEITQRPERQRTFYTGDVWKTVLCLKHYRPDLDIFTIATPWSGLTAVARLDARSPVLAKRYDEAVARFQTVPYSALGGGEQEMLNIVSNDWSVVAERLQHGNILT